MSKSSYLLSGILAGLIIGIIALSLLSTPSTSTETNREIQNQVPLDNRESSNRVNVKQPDRMDQQQNTMQIQETQEPRQNTQPSQSPSQRNETGRYEGMIVLRRSDEVRSQDNWEAYRFEARRFSLDARQRRDTNIRNQTMTQPQGQMQSQDSTSGTSSNDMRRSTSREERLNQLLREGQYREEQRPVPY